MNAVDHPPHYVDHPSGVECIEITERLPFCLGNAVKYVWRHEQKGMPLTDLKKALWYLKRESSQVERRPATHALRAAWEGKLAVIRRAAEGSPDVLRCLLLDLQGWLGRDMDRRWFLDRSMKRIQAEIERREGGR